MNKKIWFIIGVVSIIVILVGVNVFRATGQEQPQVKTVHAKEKEIVDSFMVPGTLRYENEEAFYFQPEKGHSVEILVKEGEKVKKGTPLFKYNNDNLPLENEQNALSLEYGYLQISQLKKQIDDLEKQKKELAKEAGEKEAEKQVGSELSRLNMELKRANLEVRQTQLQKKTIKKQMASLVVKSNFSGTILSVNEKVVSEQPDMQSPILRIGNPDRLIIKGLLSEYNVLTVKKGQNVTIRSDVISNQEWKGEVATVGMLPEQTDVALGEQSESVQYPIEVALETKGGQVKPGFKFIMEIETEKRKALTLPMDAIQEDDGHFVYVVKKGKVQRKDIKVGQSSGDVMEIKKGIDQKDTVILPPTEDISEGMEVIVK